MRIASRQQRELDYVFNLAANTGGIDYITAVGVDVMYDNSSTCVYPTYR